MKDARLTLRDLCAALDAGETAIQDQGGITIGDHGVIGAGLVVTRDIPAGSIAVDSPARGVRSVRG